MDFPPKVNPNSKEDVIGVLTGVGVEREVTNQNGTTTKLNVIALEAEGHKLQCTLFGPYVDELNTFIASGDKDNAVVIVQLAKAKTFQDKIHIQNCMNCTQVFFNPDCDESVVLRESLPESLESPSPMTLTQIHVEPTVSPLDEFLFNTPRMTLQALKDATTESLNVVCATVKRVLNPDCFWYTACVCNKSVIPDSNMFFCEKCNKHVKRVFPRLRALNLPELQISDDDLQTLCLIEIQKLLMANGRSLSDYKTMPVPFDEDLDMFENKLIADELSYNRDELAVLHASLVEQLNEEQREVYQKIMTSVLAESGEFYFLYGYGGIGKTFLWKTLSAALRSQGKIVLNVASSGIASLLLPNGKTAHSTFCIPLEINEKSTCNITQDSVRANLLRAASLIIWDEAPMMNRYCFEAFDRTMKDVMSKVDKNNNSKPFGGKVVLGGDFRQILPVVRKGSRGDIVNRTICSSKLWMHCNVLNLTKNMRLKSDSTDKAQAELKEFADWILKIGDGLLNSDDNGEAQIQIPEDLCISDVDKPLLSLVNFVYPNIVTNIGEPNFFEDQSILAPTLEVVEQVNDFVLSMIPGEEKSYLSCDTPCKSDEDYEVQSDWFTSEFLNDIQCSGVPNHRLTLKVGVPIMLLRNIDQASGLCNGTRLQVRDLGKNIIKASIITGKHAGDMVFLPRMDLVPNDSGLPFKFSRRQFPICLCFAMTINKSQGQSMSKVGLYLPRPVFTHGQLYVAISRVTTKRGLKMVILDEDGKPCTTTLNVVYPEIFESL